MRSGGRGTDQPTQLYPNPSPNPTRNRTQATREPLLDLDQLSMLRRVGIRTIRDLTTADKYMILKLRGHDFPQVPDHLFSPAAPV